MQRRLKCIVLLPHWMLLKRRREGETAFVVAKSDIPAQTVE